MPVIGAYAVTSELYEVLMDGLEWLDVGRLEIHRLLLLVHNMQESMKGAPKFVLRERLRRLLESIDLMDSEESSAYEEGELEEILEGDYEAIFEFANSFYGETGWTIFVDYSDSTGDILDRVVTHPTFCAWDTDPYVLCSLLAEECKFCCIIDHQEAQLYVFASPEIGFGTQITHYKQAVADGEEEGDVAHFALPTSIIEAERDLTEHYMALNA